MNAIQFTCNDLVLNGYLHMPENQTKPPVVIGSHGLFSSGDSLKQIAIANACNENGIAYFRFDHRGCGKSQGKFEEVTTLENRKNDLLAAVETICSRQDIGKRFGLFGSSMGGACCLAASHVLKSQYEHFRAMVVLAAPLTSDTLKKASTQTSVDERITPEFFQHNLQFDLRHLLADLSHILIMHGDNDRVVLPENAHELYEVVQHPKKLVVFPNGDHVISNSEHQEQLLAETVQWFKTYLL
ncbi:MAG: alpha/beta fold hydrolase [Desulfobacterales bacterium]|nr:alpha/beta fold hydrolase [Desulfobacterales bacterium]